MQYVVFLKKKCGKLGENEIMMEKKLKIKILKPVAGTFGLSCNVGDQCVIDANQATEMIEKKYAELINDPSVKPKKEKKK